MQQLCPKAVNTNPQAQPWIEWYQHDQYNQEKLRHDLQAAIDFRDRYHVPIYCGEFGVYRVAAPKEDRQQWHQDMVELFREYGIGYALWEYRGNFGLLDEETGEPNRELVETIAPRSAN